MTKKNNKMVISSRVGPIQGRWSALEAFLEVEDVNIKVAVGEFETEVI